MRSIRRGVVGFIPIVAVALRRDAYIGRLIGVDQLDRWDVGTLGEFTDTANSFPSRLWTRPISDTTESDGASRGSCGPQVVPPGYVRCVSAADLSVLDRLRRQQFTLDRLSGPEVRHKLISLPALRSVRPAEQEVKP
jgi:hypothetical protein